MGLKGLRGKGDCAKLAAYTTLHFYVLVLLISHREMLWPCVKYCNAVDELIMWFGSIFCGSNWTRVWDEMSQEEKVQRETTFSKLYFSSYISTFRAFAEINSDIALTNTWRRTDNRVPPEHSGTTGHRQGQILSRTFIFANWLANWLIAAYFWDL